METPKLPDDETARLRSLYSYDVLDTPAEEVFDRITRIASRVTGAPISLVSLVDMHRQWFKARVGLDAEETAREISFCGHAINGTDPLVVPDATADPRFADNPLVVGEAGIRFYTGLPLTTPEGQNIGTLCVIDRVPRHLDETQAAILDDLAEMVVRELEVRRAAATDPLTGALTRRMRDHMLVRTMDYARHAGLPCVFAHLDLDRLKRINDWYGQNAGDAALAAAATAMREMLGGEDSLFRLGGDTFGILLADCTADVARDRLEKLQADQAQRLVTAGEAQFTVSFSVGYAMFDPASRETAASLARRAEDALREAKAGGRGTLQEAAPFEG